MNWADATVETQIKGNILYFIFDDIQLPQLATGGDNSIAGFSFRLGLNSKAGFEDSFRNRASIYFDFEDPILTAPVVTNIISPTQILNFEKQNICQNSQNKVSFVSNINVLPNNAYILELSEPSDNFSNPTVLASKLSQLSSDSFHFEIPSTINGLKLFRIRTTNPVSVGIPGSGIVSQVANQKYDYLLNTNINNYSLCENDTLILDIVGDKYKYKISRNNIILSPFSYQKNYKFKLKKDDVFTIIANDTTLSCIDSNTIQLNVLPAPQISLSIDNEKNQYCEGDQITLRANGGKSYKYLESDIEIGTGNSLVYQLEDFAVIYAIGYDSIGCHGYSNLITPNIAPLPEKPIISFKGKDLEVQSAYRIEWYRDDTLLNETSNTLKGPFIKGSKYQVKFYTINDCQSISEPFFMTGISIDNANINRELFSIYPNPSFSDLTITCDDNCSYTLKIVNLTGQVVFETQVSNSEYTVNVSNYTSGLYTVECQTIDGEISRQLVQIVH
ncbi:MAG: T9SS type A sorting domain-containing protein [Bacteroidia bacterium]